MEEGYHVLAFHLLHATVVPLEKVHRYLSRTKTTEVVVDVV
jgi:hypothetical protein